MARMGGWDSHPGLGPSSELSWSCQEALELQFHGWTMRQDNCLKIRRGLYPIRQGFLPLVGQEVV